MLDHGLGEQDLIGDALLVPCTHATPPRHPCVTGSEGHHTDWGLGEVMVHPLCLVAKRSKGTPAEWVYGKHLTLPPLEKIM